MHLVREGFLTEADAKKYKAEADKEKVRFLAYLVDKKIIDSKTLALNISDKFFLPYVDLDAFNLEFAATDIVKKDLIKKHQILPLFRRGKVISLGIADPTDIEAQEAIKFNTHHKVEPVIVEAKKLYAIIDNLLNATANFLAQTEVEGEFDLSTLDPGQAQDAGEDDPDSTIEDAPIVKYVNKVLLDSIKLGASDIHFEPYEKDFRIRFRGDGMLYEYTKAPLSIAPKLISRIKVMSKMDIAEKRVPQDGRIKLALSKTKAIDFRVNTCPTLFGEKIVMRLLDPTSATIGIERLGFEPNQQEMFMNAINKPYGLILVTGPTGSGKTVSLYTGLNLLNTVGRNISTAEDPVEITVTGINQVNVNNKAGLTFAEALKAFLRQDPDVIMVGEIRDLETASIAVKAAQTGHLVLSTLHTNDAPQTLNRLGQMGIPPFNIVSSVILIMAQRLARRLCEHCKKEVVYPDEILLNSGFLRSQLTPDLRIFEPTGCDLCKEGYKGRVGIYQIMMLSEEMKKIILTGGNAMDIEEQCQREGINNLRQSGILKVIQGITSIAEIDRVTTA